MIDLNTLVPEFRAKVDQLLINCKNAGYVMVPNYAIRTPLEQGGLWRQSRSTAEINLEVQTLRHNGCDYLADCIVNAGPHSGEHVTNAIPGLGWHSWGEALDCTWLVSGAEEWSTKRLVNGKNGYYIYATEAQKLGLTAGGLWHSLQDWPHVQLRSAGSPLAVMNLKQINNTMYQRFGK